MPVVLEQSAVPLLAPAPLITHGRKGEHAILGWLWPTSGAINEISSLDGLRGVAVLLVLIVHCCYELARQTSDSNLRSLLQRTGSLWGFGGTGVHLFFVLSGFLLFLPFARAALGMGNQPATKNFYARRAIRILPAYWASLVILVALFSNEYLRRSEWRNLVLHITLLHNWSDAIIKSIDGPYWTLAIESQFYLLLPIIALPLIWAFRRRRFTLAILVGLSLLGAGTFVSVLKIVVRRALPLAAPHLTILDTFGFLTVFATGMACSFVYHLAKRSDDPDFVASLRRCSQLLGVGGLGLLGGHTMLVAAAIPLARVDYFFFNLIAGVGYAGILLGVLLGWPSWAALLSQPWIRFVGCISYSVYLWHYPLYEKVIIPFAAKHGSGLWPAVLAVVGTIALVFPVSYLSYQLIERPFIRARQARH